MGEAERSIGHQFISNSLLMVGKLIKEFFLFFSLIGTCNLDFYGKETSSDFASMRSHEKRV